jgi:hypothetical protein
MSRTSPGECDQPRTISKDDTEPRNKRAGVCWIRLVPRRFLHPDSLPWQACRLVMLQNSGAEIEDPFLTF